MLLAAEVNELYFAYWAAEETGAEAFEFFDGIGSEAVDLGWMVVACAVGGFGLAVEHTRGGFGSGFGGVDDIHACGYRAFDQRTQERIVGTPEDEGVRIEAVGSGLRGEFVDVDTDDFVGDLVAGPSFFDEGNQQRAGFLKSTQILSGAGGLVGVALHGGVGGDDQNVAGFGCGAGCFGSGFNDAQDRDGHGVLDGVEGEGAGGVAGDDQEFGTLLADEELGAFDGITGDCAAGLGSVGKTRGVADEGEASMRKLGDERGENGESAEAGIEYADGGWG